MVGDLFQNYWKEALANVCRQIASAISVSKQTRKRVLSERPSLTDCAEQLEPSRPYVTIQTQNAKDGSGHLIWEGDPHFPDALKWLQADLLDLIEAVPHENHERVSQEIRRVLSSSRPDAAASAKSSWFLAVMAEFERNMREPVRLAVQYFGRVEPVRMAISKTAKDLKIDWDFESILFWERTEDAVAEALAGYMINGLTGTLSVATKFAAALDVEPLALERRRTTSRC